MTQTEILPDLTPEIIDLKFIRTENDPFRTEFDPNIFFLIIFFSRNHIGQKINWSELKMTRPETEPESKHVDTKISQPKANSHRMTRLLGLRLMNTHFLIL